MEYDSFYHTVAPGRTTLAKDRRVGAIWRAAVSSIGCTMGEAASFEARAMVDSLKQIRQTIKSVEDKLEDACLEFPEYTYLLSVPGFFDLCANRSGKTSNSATPVISKRGKSDLRYALYQAALTASLKSKDFMAYFTNKLKGRAKEKGIGTKMRVKLAAKLLIIAWMKKKECFDPKYLNQEDQNAQKKAA